MGNQRPIILASGSAIRRQLLMAAGVEFTVVPADVNERAIERSYDSSNSRGIARALACAKAEAVSRAHPQALVIGADQVLALGTAIYHKPASVAQAREHLSWLRGKTHDLHSAVALAAGGTVVWEQCELASMTMRAFSDAFLESYLARAGAQICHSVGAYEYEGLGLQLFEQVHGDYYTILGLPLLALLAELRARGVIRT